MLKFETCISYTFSVLLIVAVLLRNNCQWKIFNNRVTQNNIYNIHIIRHNIVELLTVDHSQVLNLELSAQDAIPYELKADSCPRGLNCG